jgi:hypothetical protein
MNEIAYIYVLAGFLVLIVFLMIFSDLKRKLSRLEFQKLAKKLNLECDAPAGFLAKFPEIKGTYKDLPVRIYMFTEKIGEGKTRVIRIHTGIEIKVNGPKEYKLDAYEEGFFSKIFKAFGMQDIVIGNDKFDKEYIVKTNSDEMTKLILNERICDELLYMADQKFAFGFEIKNNTIYYDEAKSITSDSRADWFERILNLLTEIGIEIQKAKHTVI